MLPGCVFVCAGQRPRPSTWKACAHVCECAPVTVHTCGRVHVHVHVHTCMRAGAPVACAHVRVHLWQRVRTCAWSWSRLPTCAAGRPAMGGARRSGAGARSERSRLWKSASGRAARSQQSSRAGRRMEAASMAGWSRVRLRSVPCPSGEAGALIGGGAPALAAPCPLPAPLRGPCPRTQAPSVPPPPVRPRRPSHGGETLPAPGPSPR